MRAQLSCSIPLLCNVIRGRVSFFWIAESFNISASLPHLSLYIPLCSFSTSRVCHQIDCSSPHFFLYDEIQLTPIGLQGNGSHITFMRFSLSVTAGGGQQSPLFSCLASLFTYVVLQPQDGNVSIVYLKSVGNGVIEFEEFFPVSFFNSQSRLIYFTLPREED